MVRPKQPAKSLRTDAVAMLDCCVGLGSRLAARRIAQTLERDVAGSGLTLAQLGLMAQIAVATDDTIGSLASRTGLDQSTLSRNLRALESEGLVEITIVENDLRRRAVWLTEAGARRLEKAIPLWRAANEKLARRISKELVFQLLRQTDGVVAL
jgi:DNA-binding MarR family transcriptional regulator